MVAEEACERCRQGISLQSGQFRTTAFTGILLLTLLGPIGFREEDLRFPMASGWMAIVLKGQTPSLVPELKVASRLRLVRVRHPPVSYLIAL